MTKNINNIVAIILVFVSMIFVLYLISPSLNIFDSKLFNFHDDSQLTRIHEYLINLKYGVFPPRLAPEISFNLGFPIFNFYAPFSYLLTGLMAFIGLGQVYALKFSFILSVIIAFLSMYYFLKRFFSFFPSLLGATLYITSTYFAVEIIVRGNLAETWFLALFPLSLGLIYKNAQSNNRFIFIITTLIIFFTLTTHNIFSLTFIPLSIIYIFFLKNKIKNLISLFLALILSSYFWLPVILETQYTHAVFLAKDTHYQDHFLCIWQLWKSNGWHYGGSIPGCIEDQMSFQLGKTQIIFGAIGLITLLWQIFSRGRKIESPTTNIAIFITILTLFSLFITTYQSQFVWDLLQPVLSIFQFPWRFLVFAMFGLSFLGAYFFHIVKLPVKSIIIIFVIITLFFIGRKYFGKPLYDPKTYTDLYASNKYIKVNTAYQVREYLSNKADFNYWWSLNPEINPEIRKNGLYYDKPIETNSKYKIINNKPFIKKVKIDSKGEIKINIHYFPYWIIKINGQNYIPDKFDQLGRPIVKINPPANGSEVEIKYQETSIEKIGDSLTILGLVILLLSPFFYNYASKRFFLR